MSLKFTLFKEENMQKIEIAGIGNISKIYLNKSYRNVRQEGKADGGC
jgi:hypothetical protein